MAIEAIRNVSEKAGEILDKTADIGESVVNNGYDAAREYTDTGLEYLGKLTSEVSRFVKREPWIAVGAAFVIGYFAAQMLRRVE
jgi:hypothetical protein